MSSTIKLASVEAYRRRTFCLLPDLRLRSVEDAVRFVQERGFIFFWPIQDVVLPSLWAAVAGDRPVAPEHDDAGHVTWGWKDDMLGKRVWYYAKVLRKRATLISLDLAPYFYALSENFGSPDEDYLVQYEQGRLSHEAKNLYQALLQEGPMDTLALRKAAYMSGRSSDYRFQKAMTELQVDFKILPVGVSKAGAWHYAFNFDLVTRHFPELSEQARWISEGQAREKLVQTYLHALGAAPAGQVSKLFAWSKRETEAAVDKLSASGFLQRGLRMSGQPEEWLSVADHSFLS